MIKRLCQSSLAFILLFSLFTSAIQADTNNITATIDYPGDLDTDYKKLIAVYSLLEQMRLEHNRLGEIASKDWELYKDKWQEYALIFKSKQLPLLREQNRLKESIRKSMYDDKQWLAFNDDDIRLIALSLYGDKESLKGLATTATSLELNQLKEVDFYKLEGKFVDPLENFTTYTETDSAGDITVDNATQITVSTMARTANSGVYKTHAISGDFEHLIHVNHTATSSTGSGIYWGVTNGNFTENDMDVANSGLKCGLYNQTWNIKDFSNNNEDTYASGGTRDRWLTIDRTGTTATNKIYTDAARTNLADTITITCSNADFTTIVVVGSREATGTDSISFIVSDLDLQEAGTVPPTVITGPATDIGTTTATVSGNITATGGENATSRGFQWDTNSGAPYANNWTEAGNFGISSFTHGLTSLPSGTTIYFRAMAYNSAGWGYGDEDSFVTDNLTDLPTPPDPFTLTDLGAIGVRGDWTLPAATDRAMIRVSRFGFPTSTTDGELLYFDNNTTATWSGFDLQATLYYFSAFGEAGGTYSENYTTASIGGEDMNDSLMLIFLGALAVALLMVNVFRFNILIVIGAIFVDIALARQPNAPLFVMYAGYMLALAEATTGLVKLMFGNRKRDKVHRYVG